MSTEEISIDPNGSPPAPDLGWGPVTVEESQRWSRFYSGPFAHRLRPGPNALLAEAVRGRRPGTALDMGMGQGRNAIYLAERGWDVTGIDVSEVGIAQARAQAQKRGVRITALLQEWGTFAFGNERWDLIAAIYVAMRNYVEPIRESLRPGGLVVVEGFHRAAARRARVCGGVLFDTDELPCRFKDCRILHYEEIEGVSDFSGESLPLVRLVARKE